MLTGISAADEAERCKAAGNEAFKAQQFQSAVRHYSSAVDRDPSNSVYYSNRAMAFLKVFAVWKRFSVSSSAQLGVWMGI